MADKYITRDKLADFVEKMWEAGRSARLTPEDNTIMVGTDSGYEFVHVFDKRNYDGLIDELTGKEDK